LRERRGMEGEGRRRERGGKGKERGGKGEGGKERARDSPDQCQTASYAPVKLTHTWKIAWFGQVVFEIREHTERQTYKHADCTTPHLCRGEVKTKRSFGEICPVRLSVRL